MIAAYSVLDPGRDGFVNHRSRPASVWFSASTPRHVDLGDTALAYVKEDVVSIAPPGDRDRGKAEQWLCPTELAPKLGLQGKPLLGALDRCPGLEPGDIHRHFTSGRRPPI